LCALKPYLHRRTFVCPVLTLVAALLAGRAGLAQSVISRDAAGRPTVRATRITERLRMKLHAEISNFLNHPFLGGGNSGVTSTSFGYITAASGSRSVALRGSLDW